MKTYYNFFVALLILCMTVVSGRSQTMVSSKFGEGLKILGADSSMLINFTARFQTLYNAEQTLEKGTLNNDFEDEMMIRRSRFKFDGFVYSPKIKYKLEFGFSNRDMGNKQPDMDKHFSGSPGYILDAVLKYEFVKGIELWFGQTKLPGNRERVISSQQLQFVDRSLVNNYFNLDRDIGIQLHANTKIGKMKVKPSFAATMGEGRNVTSSDNDGKSYTARLDLLPMGEFTGKGDFFGSDLKRESSPRLLIGGSYNFNQKARRSAGQLGSFIADTLIGDFGVAEVDMTFKYKGFSFFSEFADRSLFDGVGSKYFLGSGFTGQMGYLLKNNLEIAARFTQINPQDKSKFKEYTLGLSKYIVGHSLKIQSDASYVETDGSDTKGLRFRLQVEMQF